MKKFTLRLTLLAFITSSILISCNKIEKISEEEIKNDNPTSKITLFDVNGKLITEKDIDKNLEFTIFLESVENIENQFKAIYFESDDIAYDYFKKFPKYSAIVSKIDYVREIRTLAVKTGDIDLENPTWDNISDEMKVLLNQFKGNENITGKTSGVGVLNNYYPHGGGAYPLLGMPIFSLGGFRNKASAATGVGIANFLFDRTWFRGSKFYLLLGTMTPVDLTHTIMNNRAESAL